MKKKITPLSFYSITVNFKEMQKAVKSGLLIDIREGMKRDKMLHRDYIKKIWKRFKQYDKKGEITDWS